MVESKLFESYPAWMILVYYFFSFSVYAAGLYLVYLILPLFSLVFFIYIAFLEVQVLRSGCVRCYYYGKRCAAGKGTIAKILFKKDEKRRFNERNVTAKDMIPSFLPTLVALIAGAYLTYAGWPNLSLLVIGLAIWPLLVMFLGNPIVYGKIACPHCKQGELGCPTCDFFMKMEKKGKK